MLDPLSACGLASSIITFADFTCKVGKRAQELSQVTGDLPPDIQQCKEIAEILARATERLRAEFSATQKNNGRPTTATSSSTSSSVEADLLVIFDQCTDVTKTFLELLDELANAKSLNKVLKIVRKEGKLQRIHDALDKKLVEVLYLLGSHTSDQTKHIEFTLEILRKEMLQHHAALEARMSDSLSRFANELGNSKEEVLGTIRRSTILDKEAANNRAVEVMNDQEESQMNASRPTRVADECSEQNANTRTAKQDMILCHHCSPADSMSFTNPHRRDIDMATQMAQMERTILRALTGAEQQPPQYRSPVAMAGKGLVIRAEFEFSLRTEIITIHISHCAKFVSSRISVFPRFRVSDLLPGSQALCTAAKAVVPGVQSSLAPDEHNTIPLILTTASDTSYLLSASSEIRNAMDPQHIDRAIQHAYRQCRGPLWSALSFMRVARISYVKFINKGNQTYYHLSIDDILSEEGSNAVGSNDFIGALIDSYAGYPQPETPLNVHPGPANQHHVHGYALRIEEEVCGSLPTKALVFLKLARLLLACSAGMTVGSYITTLSCLSLGLATMAFLLLCTTGGSYWSMFSLVTYVSMYYSIWALSFPAKAAADLAAYYSCSDTIIVLNLFTIACFSPVPVSLGRRKARDVLSRILSFVAVFMATHVALHSHVNLLVLSLKAVEVLLYLVLGLVYGAPFSRGR